MANTTNFGWETPDDTDLVKDGASAMRTLGNAIDTSLVDLKGGTTGQVLSKASNTDMDFTWVAQDDSNAIQNAIVDAKGDLISATAADTPARLAVGTDGQVLTADSTQSTGLKWATPASALTWTQRRNGSAEDYYQIEYNGTNLYVIVGASGKLATSPDGITWTDRTSGFGTNAIYAIGYGNGLWVAVGNNGTITTSTDGITWTARTSNMGTNAIYAVKYANSAWVAVGEGGGTVNTGGLIYSSDGITWTRKSQSITVGDSYYSLGHNGTNWIIGANLNTNNSIYAATPSGTWTAQVIGSGTITKIFYDGTRTIYLNSSHNAFFSTSATGGSTTVFSSAYGNGDAVSPQKTTYYNGKIYFLALTFFEYSSTPVNNYANGIKNYGTPPTVRAAGNGTLTNQANCFFANSAGFFAVDSTGRIFTSF